MTRKEQKLSLEGACRKYLKKYEESDSSTIEAVKDSPKKRAFSSTDSEGEESSPKPKKKVIRDNKNETNNRMLCRAAKIPSI